MPTMRPLAVLATLALAGLAFAAATLNVGDTVGDETLLMGDGREVKLSSHEGSAVVLVFYGPWTRRAPDELRRIDAIRAARAKQKLVVVGVARDAKPADAKKFGEDAKVGFPQAADPKAELYAKFATKGLPWVAVMDGKRKLRHSAAEIDEEAIEAVLTELLGPRDAAPAPSTDGAPAGGAKK